MGDFGTLVDFGSPNWRQFRSETSWSTTVIIIFLNIVTKNVYMYFELFANISILTPCSFNTIQPLPVMVFFIYFFFKYKPFKIQIVGLISLSMQAGKVRKPKLDQDKYSTLGTNLKGFVIMAMLMMLMMFAVHCTWVTSNAYSSPSIVLATYNNDG